MSPRGLFFPLPPSLLGRLDTTDPGQPDLDPLGCDPDASPTRALPSRVTGGDGWTLRLVADLPDAPVDDPADLLEHNFTPDPDEEAER